MTSPDPLAKALQENHELRQKLAQSQTELRQLLYAASHDLQEPLRGIITYAQLLERQAEADSQNKEYTAFILGSAVRMRDLLQELMVYSRAGAAKKRSSIKLSVPLQMALLKLDPEIRSAGAHVKRDALPEAIADENDLAQVFHQLLTNAIRFRSNIAPEIAITAEQGTDECTVTVRDNGPGINPRFCDEVLLPFKRLHGKDVAGSGLGLAICQKIVRAHGGRLWVESDGVHGTAIRFTLPT